MQSKHICSESLMIMLEIRIANYRPRVQSGSEAWRLRGLRGTEECDVTYGGDYTKLPWPLRCPLECRCLEFFPLWRTERAIPCSRKVEFLTDNIDDIDWRDDGWRCWPDGVYCNDGEGREIAGTGLAPLTGPHSLPAVRGRQHHCLPPDWDFILMFLLNSAGQLRWWSELTVDKCW